MWIERSDDGLEVYFGSRADKRPGSLRVERNWTTQTRERAEKKQAKIEARLERAETLTEDLKILDR